VRFLEKITVNGRKSTTRKKWKTTVIGNLIPVTQVSKYWATHTTGCFTEFFQFFGKLYGCFISCFNCRSFQVSLMRVVLKSDGYCFCSNCRDFSLRFSFLRLPVRIFRVRGKKTSARQSLRTYDFISIQVINC
jgi:hypothetical protein